ncbi:MAG: hypothetical protein LQ347_000063 [Umbilicaria vellea]|nr:MAG: hypothetical protein LQ347_000063 [Umbilicaria vellea]
MQDQWQRKKQTKEEARKAKFARLDPDNAKSAKDVMEENARKRKRQEGQGTLNFEGDVPEPLKEGLKVVAKKQKRQKRDVKAGEDCAGSLEPGMSVEGPAGRVSHDELAPAERKTEKRKEKRECKEAKEEMKAAKSQAKKARKRQEIALVKGNEAFDGVEIGGDDLDPIDVSGMVGRVDSRASSTVPPSPLLQSPVFDVLAGQSAPSSISSITPNGALAEQHDHSVKKSKTPRGSPEELKARLQQRIETLRAARKADGLYGAPARNRQELMEARRRKEEQRKAHKQELRQMAKEEEQRKQDQVLARGSPVLSPAVGTNAVSSPLNGTPPPNNFSFGRVAFEDGQQMDAALSTTLTTKKRKGPQDPLTAMKAVERKQVRINGLDKAKRTDIEEKDLWLNARKRAHGERVRDDTSLLKKTLKRKEQTKRKSEKEWNERKEGVQKGQAMRQKKREDNLQKRREEKGMKGKRKSGKGGMGVKKGKPKPRPGFEGTFKAKHGGGTGAKP